MANAFGGFTVNSPLTSQNHNTHLTLASNSIRDNFGPTVQTVFDAIVSRGNPPPTLVQIISNIKHHCKRDVNSERMRLVEQVEPLQHGRKRVKVNMAKGGEDCGFIMSSNGIRAALIVLLQHSMIRAVPPPKRDQEGLVHEAFAEEEWSGRDPGKKKEDKCTYVIQVDNAAYLHRYPRFVEYAKKVYQYEGAAIIEELLVKGRMGTMEVVDATLSSLKRQALNQKEEGASEEDGDEVELTTEEIFVLEKNIESTLKQLVQGGFVEMVPPMDAQDASDHDGEKEAEFSTVGAKRSHDEMTTQTTNSNGVKQEDNGGGTTSTTTSTAAEPFKPKRPRRTLLQSRLFPNGAVWRANIPMFHASLRAFYLGRLVQERYGDQIPYCGSIVTAALKLAAHKKFAPTTFNESISEEVRQSLVEERRVFTPESILPYLPPTVVANLKSKAGGARSNLSADLVKLSRFTYPQIIMEVEEALGHDDGGKFEVATRSLLMHLRTRIMHQMVKSHHGDVAARICSILDSRGYLESDIVADNAMVPAKDAREVSFKQCVFDM